MGSSQRIDNNLHYSCGKCNQCVENGWQLNCRWATFEQQANNKRNNKKITFNGQTLTIAQWSKKTGIPQGAISYRLKKGWNIKDILTKLIE